MTLHQKIFAVCCSLVLFIVIIGLVKRGRLREEFAGIWLVVGGLILAPVFWYDALLGVTRMIGAVLPTTALFIFGIIILLMVALHLSIRTSRLSDQVKNLTQQISILEARLGRKPSGTDFDSHAHQ